jgi:formate hydrogenlyase subunit 3/multisubunit Na+/H+ antiporter MnhD subunit
MTLSLISLAVLAASGLAALFASRSDRLASALGAGGSVLGCSIGLVAAVQSLFGEAETFRIGWGLYGSFSLRLDPLSCFFLLPIYLLSGLAAVYGAEYLMAFRGKKRLGPPWLFFNLLAASMALVVLAHDALVFLVAWEAMALASFFLVTFENEKQNVREAGWVYLIATHLGTAFLLPFFLMLGAKSGSLDFDGFPAAAAALPAGPCFLLAVIGFGTKAGFMPLHVWLPEAHPAAPSHVSAVMSGVMIKTGIYGLIRALGFLGPPPAWWGWLLIAIGLSSGILGVLFALAQRDLKRLLAFSSVENIGIIALGLGLGLVGISSHVPLLAMLGFGGALLHVVNHALFKGLLFLGAGAVAHAAHTREIEQLGGLLKKMPWTGFAFLTGAMAICGLPPLNGFVSELMIYIGAFGESGSGDPAVAAPALLAIAGLALIGGLAAACFTKAFGIVFLGEPRSGKVEQAREVGVLMQVPMAILAALCLAIGLLAPVVIRALEPVLVSIAPVTPSLAALGLGQVAGWASTGVSVVLALGALGALFALLRSWLLHRRTVSAAGTWDCGYAQPTARMQYTASSFADPINRVFRPFLRTRRAWRAPKGYFPGTASFATETPDLSREQIFAPAFAEVKKTLARLRWLQHGDVHFYILYVALTLIVLLVWKL